MIVKAWSAFLGTLLAIACVDIAGEGKKPHRQTDHHRRYNGRHANYPNRQLFVQPRIILYDK